MSKYRTWLQRGLALTLALTMTVSMSVSAMAAPFPEGEDIASNTTQTAQQDITLAEPASGLRFDSDKQEYAEMSDTVAIPQTAEIWVKLDPDENRRQIIFNNYSNGAEDSWGLEVQANNNLRYWERVDGEQTSLYFNEVPVCTESWMLLSVVRDLENQKVTVYVNGEEAAEQTGKLADGTQLTYPLRFGTDTRNTYWLDGEIGEVRFWNDARTAEEIAQYAGESVTGAEDGLAHAWVLDEAEDLGPDTVFQDLAGDVDVTAAGFQAEFNEPEAETEEEFSLDFTDGNAGGAWRTLKGGTYGASVQDGVLVLENMAQNEPVFLTGDGVPYLRNAVYEMRAKVAGGSDPSFGISFRNSVNSGAANWIVFKGNDELLAQTSEENWDDPWTNAEYPLENDAWYDFRFTIVGKTIKVEVKADGEDNYTTLVDGSNDTIWDGWLTNAGYLGFCNWGSANDTFYIDSLKVSPVDASSVQHKVNFELWGGAYEGGLEDQTVSDDGKVTEPDKTPTRTGFTFTGWYKDAACTEEWDFATDTVWKDTTIYAGWEYIYQSAGFQNMTGVSFDGPGDQLVMEERLADVPLSFEATVKLPKELEGRGGVIIGNYMNAGYYDYDLGYVNFEVYENGAPRLYWSQGRRNQPGGDTQSAVFSSVDLRQDEWVHVAITFDPETDTVKCYINGVLVSTVDDFQFDPVIPAQALKVGGDYRGTGGQVTDSGYNNQYFKGEIANVSVWSDVRTEEEIAADVAALKESAENVPQGQEGLLACWSFADADADLYTDLSASGNDVADFVDWIAPNFAEGDYSMVALPDTQFLSSTHPTVFKELTQWIVDNQEKYNIRAVMHMGDMVDSGNTTQWGNCENAMYILDSDEDIAWMPMRGNHDPSDGFNQTFPYAEFADRSYFGGSYEHEVLNQDKLDSTYWEITVGDRDYLILSLGWAPTQGAIDWADDIIKANPEKNVIVTTHAFMYWDGTHLNDEDLDYTSAYTKDGMDGSDIWEQLGEGNPNVVLAMGGHIGFPDIIARTDENGAGKEVTSLLCDAQGIDLTYGLGMMALLTFHEDSDQVDVNWYSAHEGKLFRTRNQFSINVPHVVKAERTITAIADPADIQAYLGTDQADLGLPETVDVTLSDGKTVQLPVMWSCGSYDPSKADTYTFTGTPECSGSITNPSDIKATVMVTLRGEKKISAVNSPEAFSVDAGTEQAELGLPATVSAVLSDGSEVQLPVHWDCVGYVADAAGTYAFTGTLETGEGAVNPDGLTAKVRVTVRARVSGRPVAMSQELVDQANNAYNNLEDAQLEFVSMADTHIASYESKKWAFQNIEDWEDTIGFDSDAVLLDGDVGANEYNPDQGNQVGYYTAVKQLLEETFPTQPILFATGNHDLFDRFMIPIFDEAGKAEAGWSYQSESGDGYFNFYNEINGFDFITLDYRNQSSYKNFLSATLEQIKAEADYDPQKPIFIQIHSYIGGTTNGYKELGNAGANLRAVLGDDWPQAVVLAAHTHFSTESTDAVWQGNFTVMNNGSMDYVEFNKDAIENEVCNWVQGSMEDGHNELTCNFITILADGRTVVRRFDVTNQRWIGLPWIVDTTDGDEGFTYRPEQRSKIAPWFAADDAITVSNVQESSAEITFPQASDDELTEYYTVTLRDVKSNKDVSYFALPDNYDYADPSNPYPAKAISGTFKAYARFYLRPYPETMHYVLSQLDPATSYRVIVTAYDSFDNASQVLDETFTTAGTAPEEPDYPEQLPENIRDGLLVDMAFEGDLTDAQKQEWTGVSTGTVGYEEGYVTDQALHVSSGGYVTLAGRDELQLGIGDATVSFWYKGIKEPGNQVIIGNKNWRNAWRAGFNITVDYDATPAHTLSGAIGDDGGSYDGALYFTFSDVNDWSMITLTIDRETQTATCYVNGVQCATGKIPQNATMTGPGDLRIGADANGSFASAEFLMDSLQVWNRALSSEDILAVYGAAKANAPEEPGVTLEEAIDRAEKAIAEAERDVVGVSYDQAQLLAARESLKTAKEALENGTESEKQLAAGDLLYRTERLQASCQVSIMDKGSYQVVSCDSWHDVGDYGPNRTYAPEKAIDGDISTAWHTNWAEKPEGGALYPFPHEIVLDLGETVTISGMQRIGRTNRDYIRNYTVAVADTVEGLETAELFHGQFADAVTAYEAFDQAMTGRYVKVTILDVYDMLEPGREGRQWAYTAELGFTGRVGAPEPEPEKVTLSVTGPETAANASWNDYVFGLTGDGTADTLHVKFTVNDPSSLFINEQYEALGGFALENGLIKKTENGDDSATYEAILIYDLASDAPVLPTDVFKLSLRTADKGSGSASVTLDWAACAHDGSEVQVQVDGANGSVTTQVTWNVCDVNGDGKVDISDVSCMRDYYQCVSGGDGWDEAKRCDVNGDGRVDVADFIQVGRAVLDAEEPAEG